MRYKTLRYLIFLCFPIFQACEDLEKLNCALPNFGSGGTGCPPVAENVHITGTVKDTEVLTGNYTYKDLDGDREGFTTFRWLRQEGAPRELKKCSNLEPEVLWALISN